MKTKQEYVNAYVFPGYILLLHNSHPKVAQVREMFEKYGRMKTRLWSKRVRDVNRYYIETGIGGGYDTARLVDVEWNGVIIPQFEDTDLKEENGRLYLERWMVVDGRRFSVNSIFPEAPALTPTDKMLSLIESTEKY